MSVPSWSSFVARSGCSRWKLTSSNEPTPISSGERPPKMMYWDLQLPENIRVGVSNNRARTAMPRIAGRRVVDSIVNIGADVLAGAGTNVFVAASGTYILTALSRWGLRLECTNNPIRDRVFRNTRDTLRAYRDAGVWPIAATIPDRVVDDFPVKMTAEEQRLYCSFHEPQPAWQGAARRDAGWDLRRQVQSARPAQRSRASYARGFGRAVVSVRRRSRN